MTTTNDRATLEDVARLAGVSRATASRVIRGDVAVTPTKSKAVLAAVKELGYTPNMAARALASSQTGTVALIIPEPDELVFGDPFFARTIKSVSKNLEQWDYHVVLTFADASTRGQRTAAFLRTGAVDGAIVLSHHQFRGEIESFIGTAIPLVFIGRLTKWDAKKAWVDNDNYSGAAMAARHLIDLGMTRPAQITGALDMVAGQDRHDGFSETWAERSITPLTLPGDFSIERATSAALELAPKITSGEVDSVFIASDPMAAAAMSVWRDQGISVPGDVRVISYDDTDIAASLGLTSLSNPTDKLGAYAARMLRDVLTNTWSGEPVIIPATMTQRASTQA